MWVWWRQDRRKVKKGGGKTRQITPRCTRRILCAWLLAHPLLPFLPSQPFAGTPAPPGPKSYAFWGIRNRCASCPSSLNSHKNICTCCPVHTFMLAAIQNRHRDPVRVTGQRDPGLDPGLQRLRQERHAIGFSCDPPTLLSCIHPLLLIKTNCF